jgi:hypothetical protein
MQKNQAADDSRFDVGGFLSLSLSHVLGGTKSGKFAIVSQSWSLRGFADRGARKSVSAEKLFCQ